MIPEKYLRTLDELIYIMKSYLEEGRYIMYKFIDEEHNKDLSYYECLKETIDGKLNYDEPESFGNIFEHQLIRLIINLDANSKDIINLFNKYIELTSDDIIYIEDKINELRNAIDFRLGPSFVFGTFDVYTYNIHEVM